MSRRKSYWRKRFRQQQQTPDMPSRVVRGTGETRKDEEGNNGKLRGVGVVGTVAMKSRKQRLVEKWCHA